MFTHLHTHSYFSFLTGLPSPEQLVQAGVEYGMPALALTDRHGLTGSVAFYEACQLAGIKAILGLELVVKHRLGQGDLVLLAMNRSGWRSLCRLSSVVQTHHQRDPELGVTCETLAEESKGLICLTGGQNSLLTQSLARSDLSTARFLLNDLQTIFGDRIYIELYNLDVNPLLLKLAEEFGLPTVAANPVYYLSPEQADLQRTLSAMRLNCQITNVPPECVAPAGAHFLSSSEMEARFTAYPSALANIQVITERCNLALPLGQPHYPAMALPPDESADSHLRKLAEAGAESRYGEITSQIRIRLDHELEIIAARNYAPLFLIVQEILSYARERGVPISSRGSAASSLVAYCLGITTPDPLALDLYFERFLNPARGTPPDIDTDLCSERRDEVLQHVYDHYGADRVAMVATINRFRPRSALREVAKAYGLSTKEISSLVDGIPSRGWGPPARHYDRSAPFGDLRNVLHRLVPIYREAESILKFPRHLSVHPGGIVITPEPMTDLVPTHLASKGMIITQFDLESIEKLGLVKIDLLGTRGLTVIGEVAEKIHRWNKDTYRTPLEVLAAIPEDDPETAALVQSAQTIGCFQIESPGMRATLKEINAQSPADLMVALALYRPGPMTGGLKTSFVRRHLGQEPIEHLHPALAALLQDTYGVILYQEQVLLIASRIAGLSLADADLLRRAMSHFDPGERMKTLKKRFVRGAEEQSNIPSKTAEYIWDLMAAFAGYGFPKAHAASYAQVSWRSAWCKAHYPAEFIAAVLAGWGGYYRQRVYLNEARRLELSPRPPHINHAQRRFSVTYPKGIPTLYMGLDQVRDLTYRSQQRILDGRPFRSMEDFLMRVDPRPQEAENLIQVGALDGFGSIPDLLSRIRQRGWAYAQPPLWVLDVNTGEPDWNLAQRVEAQISILGASLDAHPLELAADQVAHLDVMTTLEALSHSDEEIRVVGIRQTTQRFFAHQGEPFYILELEDLDGVLPVMMTPDFYRRYRQIMSSTAPFVVEGKMALSHTTGEPVLAAQRMYPLAG